VSLYSYSGKLSAHPARLVRSVSSWAFQRRHAGAGHRYFARPSIGLPAWQRGGNQVVPRRVMNPGIGAADTDAAGQRVFAPSARDRVHLRSQRGPAITLDCACTPTGLFRLAGLRHSADRTCGGPLQVLRRECLRAHRAVARRPGGCTSGGRR